MTHFERLWEAEGRLAMIAAGLASKKTIRRIDAQVIRKELASLRSRTTDDRAAVVTQEKP